MYLRTTIAIAISLSLPFLPACSTLRYPAPVTSASPMGQALLSQATAKACAAVLSYDKTTLYKLTNAMKTREDALQEMREGPYKSRLREELALVEQSVAAMEQGVKFVQRAKPGRLHVAVLGAAADRREVFAFRIAQALQKQGWQIAADPRDADYELTALIRQDGVDVGSYNFLFLYYNYQLTGVVSIDLVAREIKTGAVLYEDTVTENSYYKRNYLLGIGPINTTSLSR
jgi:hypothetical protein